MANDIIITPVSASIQFSGSANASIKLTVDASGSLSITGNSGSLFSITDNLSGSLMSVNTIAGLPILEVFSDNRVNMGKYASEAIKIQSGGSDVALGSGSVMFVTSSGRVGIGINTPVNKLDVAGNISASVITASLFSGSLSGSVFGTSSWATNALTAALATSINFTASNATTAQTASYLTIANSYTITNLTASNISSSGVSVFNKTGFGTSSALGNASPMIDVSYGDYQNAGCIRLGADLGVNNSRTTNARKFGVISSFPYNNTSQSIFVIGADAQSTTVNAVNIGGGSGNMASPTRILFFTTSSIQESGTERMRIDGSGNVGIGTTSPNTLLNVGSGTPSTAANGIQFGSDTSANLYRILTGFIKTDGGLIVTGTTSCTTISANGTVNVTGASGGYIVSRRDTSAAAWQWYSQTGELRLYDQINALDRLIVTTAGLFTFTSAISASSFTGSVFGTSSWATNSLTASSVVGTVTSASYALSASTAVNSQTASYLTPTNNYTVNNLTANATGSFGMVGVGTSSPVGKIDIRPDPVYPGAGAVIVDTDGGNNPRIRMYRPDGGSSTSSYAIHIRNDSGNLNILTAGTNATLGSETVSSKFYFTSTGRLGIGTTGPQTTLDIIASNAAAVFRTDTTISSSYSGLRIYNDLNSNVRGLEIDYAGSAYAGALIVGGPVGESAAIVTTGAYPLVLGTSNSAKITILSNGNVGIGSSNPANKLDVAGNISASVITASLFSGSLSGSHFGTSSFAISASYAPGGSGLTGGTTNYIPLWTGAATQGISVISQSGTIIGLSGSLNVLQNVTASLFNGLNFIGGINTISSSTTTTIDLRYAVTQMQLSQSITTFAHSNATSGTATWMLATVGAGTAVTITWPTSYKWPGGVAPSLTTTSAKRDVYQFMSYDGSSTGSGYVFATVVAQNM